MKLIRITFALFALATGLICQRRAEAQVVLQKSVFGNGGGVIENGARRVAGTVGQPNIGRVSSSSNAVSAGFWYVATPTAQLPRIGVTPTSLTFNAASGGVNPDAQTLSITNTGYGTLSWTVSVTEDADWLSLSPTSDDCTDETDEVTVSVDAAGLAHGRYNAAITISAISASNTPQTVTVTLNFFFYLCEMEPGWNLISIPIQLSDDTLDTVLQSIIDDYKCIWTYDAANREWKRHIVSGPGLLNNLKTIEAGKGYWIQMASSAVLGLNEGVAADELILLEPGWNLVGYNCLTERPIGEVLPSVCNSVWAYNAADGEWERHIVGGPGFLNNLDTMQPWRGYWIAAIAGGEWDVSGSCPPAAPASPLVSAEFLRRHVSTDRPGIPCTVWGSVVANGAKMRSRGTARRAPTVVLKVNDKVKSSYQLGEVGQYGDYYVLDAPVDSSARIELYVQSEDAITKAASISPTTNPGQIIRLDLYVQVPPKVSLLHQNYPNPFNPDTWIPYQLTEDAHVAIKIYTSAGQLVRTLNLGYKPIGFYTDREKSAHWDGKNEAGEHVASGVYFYSIKAGDLTTTRKMVIMR